MSTRSQLRPTRFGIHPHFLPALAGILLASVSIAQPQTPAAQTTLVIFANRPISAELWSALTAALRQELASSAPEIRMLTGPAGPPQASPLRGSDDAPRLEILRGDTIAPGLEVVDPITVFLQGDCLTNPAARPYFHSQIANPGTLGWVELNHGRIAPFVHVACDHLAQLLRPRALGLNPDSVNRLMAFAIARVLLHEWIHIATQSPNHARHGLGSATFSATDLIPPPIASTVQPTAPGRHRPVAHSPLAYRKIPA